jgi:hypothetical protein
MRNILLACGLVLGLSCMPLAAQTFVLATGDSSLDITLGSLNVEASTDVGTFTAELSTSYQVPRVQIQSWITVERLQPAEVYMVLELSRIARTTPTVVIASYRKHRGKGWGAVARDLGIRPGSAEWKAWKADADDRTQNVKNRKKHDQGDAGGGNQGGR